MVLTSNGYKRIDEIQIGDYVLTHKNKYKSSNNEFQNVKLKKLALMNIQLKHIIDNLK